MLKSFWRQKKPSTHLEASRMLQEASNFSLKHLRLKQAHPGAS